MKTRYLLLYIQHKKRNEKEITQLVKKHLYEWIMGFLLCAAVSAAPSNRLVNKEPENAPHQWTNESQMIHNNNNNDVNNNNGETWENERIATVKSSIATLRIRNQQNR